MQKKSQFLEKLSKFAGRQVMLFFGSFFALIFAIFFLIAPSAFAFTLNFSAIQNGTLPANQVLNVTNNTPTGGEPISTWNLAANAPVQSSISASPTSSSIAINPGQSQTITFSITTTSLAPGVYTQNDTLSATIPNGQPAPNSPQTVTINYTISPPVPNPPTSFGGQNTSVNSAVLCGTIQLSWNASAGATDYQIYRSTTSSPAPSTSFADAGNSTSYNYTPVVTDPAYFYWVAARNSGGGISSLVGPTAQIAPTPCQSDFNLSNKVIKNVNGKLYPYKSPGCFGNAVGGTIPQVFKNGDTVTWSVNVCNAGNKDASSVVLTDTLTDLVPVTGSYTLNGVSVSPAATSGNCSLGSCTLTFNIASITHNTNAILAFNALVTTPTGGSQNLNRFRNQATFYFAVAGFPITNTACVGTGDDSAHQCVLPDPGPIVFFNGAKVPGQQEINP